MNNLPLHNCVAVIVAGGQGLRMQNAIPKQFLPINDKPILCHTIKAFVDAIPSIKIILVLPVAHFSYANVVLQQFESGINLTIVAGGNNRYESVKNGLRETQVEDIIFVHDGVRPLLSGQLILSCLDAALQYGSAIPVVPVTDTIRIVEHNNSKTIDREMLRAVQTPQTFQGKILLPAFEQDYQTSFTDEASVVEHLGQSIHLVPGEKSNIKITTPEDLIFAAAIQKQQYES